MERWDAVVIGGGIAGGSLGIHLTRNGWKTLILEKKEFPRHKTCGEFMSPESSEMLEQLGLPSFQTFVTGSPIMKTEVIFRHGKKIDSLLPSPAWGISRYELDSLLLETARNAGAKTWHGVVASSIEHKGGCFIIHIKNEQKQVEAIRSKCVFGAWGHSKNDMCSSLMKPKSKQKNQKLHYIGLKAHYTGIVPRECVELYFCDGGYVGINPIENNVVNVAGLVSLCTVQAMKLNRIDDILQNIAKSNPKLEHRLAGGTAINSSQTAQAPVVLSKKVLPWGVIPHVGDAAVMIPPLCGDGMSIALRSSLRCSEIASPYLRGEITFDQWKKTHIQTMNTEFHNLVQRGRRLHQLSCYPILTKTIPPIVRIWPSFADVLVRTSRLTSLKT